MGFLILLAVVAFFVYRAAKPEEREKYFDMVRERAAHLKAVVTAPRPELEEFRGALCARSPRLLVTPAIATLNAIVFAGLLFGSGAMSDAGTLLGWGASMGIRTTNGEWWRLLTSLFVHDGAFYLLISVAILWQLGSILERLVGGLAFALVYLLAGVFAGLVHLSSHPVDATAGSTGAIFGLYGLLVATIGCQLIFKQSLKTPQLLMKRLAIVAGLFTVYVLAGGRASAAQAAAFGVGLAFGLALASRSGEEQPNRRRVGFAAGGVAALAVMYAIPLRNISDVKPEIARLIAAERQSAQAYQSSLDAFKKGRATADTVAQLAERTFMPELHAADLRLVAFTNVPAEHRPLIADAREYIRLRYDSWQLRAAALRTNMVPRRDANPAPDASWRLQAEKRFRSNMAALGKAETAERAAVEAFQQLTSHAELASADK